MGEYKGLPTDKFGRLSTQAAVEQAAAELLASEDGRALATRAVKGAANAIWYNAPNQHEIRRETSLAVDQLAVDLPDELAPPGVRPNPPLLSRFKRSVMMVAAIRAAAGIARDPSAQDEQIDRDIANRAGEVLNALGTEISLSLPGTLSTADGRRDGQGRAQTDAAVEATVRDLLADQDGFDFASTTATHAYYAVAHHRDDPSRQQAIADLMQERLKSLPGSFIPPGIAGDENLAEPFTRTVVARATAEASRSWARDDRKHGRGTTSAPFNDRAAMILDEMSYEAEALLPEVLGPQVIGSAAEKVPGPSTL